ncbi:MAG: hypothetical protein ABIQ56_06765, partial [Chitinophagaceae bacterium]
MPLTNHLEINSQIFNENYPNDRNSIPFRKHVFEFVTDGEGGCLRVTGSTMNQNLDIVGELTLTPNTRSVYVRSGLRISTLEFTRTMLKDFFQLRNDVSIPEFEILELVPSES